MDMLHQISTAISHDNGAVERVNGINTRYLYNNYTNILNSTDNPSSTSIDGIRFEIPFLIITCLIGYVGNFLVLVVYSRRKYRRSNAALYVLNLAVGDTLALTVVLFHVTEFYRVTWPILWRSDIQCAIHRTFRFLGFDITVFTMVAIAIDRYFAVCHPLTFRTKFTPRRTTHVLAFLWVLSMATAFPAALVFKAIYRTDNTGVSYKGKLAWACKLVLPPSTAIFHFKAIYLNIVLFIIPTLITAFIYIIIVKNVWRTGRGLRRSTNVANHWKAARTLLVVFLAYVVCHGFFATYNTLFQFKITGSVPAVVNNVGLLLPYANSMINPVIYSFMHASFRKACLEVVIGKFRPNDYGMSSSFGMRGSVNQLEGALNNHRETTERSNWLSDWWDVIKQRFCWSGQRAPKPSVAVTQTAIGQNCNTRNGHTQLPHNVILINAKFFNSELQRNEQLRPDHCS